MNVTRSLLDDIKTKQLKWYGHVQRMEEGRLPKEVMKWSPPGRRKRGRPEAIIWAEGIRGLLGGKGINPFRSYVGPCPILWFSSSAPMLGDVGHFFCCVCTPAPLLEPVWRLSSCSTDFSRQRAQDVLLLFLGRPRVLMWTGDCAFYLRSCASFLPRINKSWGVYGLQKNWIGKG